MAHVIDFTLFYGGVASAPAAELPFVGSSFDVQRGTARRAVFGVPEVESVAIAELGAVTGAAPVLGVPALSYAALWKGAGGVSRTASIGAVSAATGVELADVGAGAREAELGDVSAAVGVELSGLTAGAKAAAFGVPDVGFGLLVEPESMAPRGHTFGTPAYGWRKCPRWDLCAQVRREAELGAEIRPAPVAAQVWRGEGCVRRERTMAAVVARWADLHTVARRRNAMDAAVRRKEQI